MGPVLVINSGSSSIKFALFDGDLTQALSGRAEEIGGASTLTIGTETERTQLPDHGTAMRAILAALDTGTLAAAAHRVVHGGTDLTAPALLTPDTIAQIEALSPLAPLHNPPALAGIRAIAALAPALPQAASFDTAFHATAPEVERRYALPPHIEAQGIRRYGFHGISYAGLVRDLPTITGQPLPDRLLALHLGNGASLCAIRQGAPVATTMGYSPLEGLTMGTRSGSLDPNAVLRLAADLGLEATARLLNRESGLKGLAGHSDMRALHADPSPQARFAIDHFCHSAIRHAGAMIAAMGGLDAVAFTGGIGEHDAIVRTRILDGLAWTGLEPADTAPRLTTATSKIHAWIVPAAEERTIARDALTLLGKP